MRVGSFVDQHRVHRTICEETSSPTIYDRFEDVRADSATGVKLRIGGLTRQGVSLSLIRPLPLTDID